ncbi:MAG: glycosyltransferase family 39 protein [Isosphaeraceae bacterium]
MLRAKRLLPIGIIVAVSVASALGNTSLGEPPRYDGAGYATLALSILGGSGYRAIDHPDRPPHDHFPPAYPAALAGLWGLTGPSWASARLLSVAFTSAAAGLGYLWARRQFGPKLGFALGLAVASNWMWGRVGGSIQAEPMFLMLSSAALVLAGHARRRRGIGRWVATGLVLGLATLTRHVGACLVAAVVMDLALARRVGAAALVGLVWALVVAPWIAWVGTVRGNPQVDYLANAGLVERLQENALFYIRRLPDAIVGPVIEVGTVFRPGWERPATWLAGIGTGLIAGGWVLCLRNPRRRLAALTAFSTLALLLAWPFTEAGRFLIPLVPMILIGAAEGLGGLLGVLGWARARPVAVLLVALASLPYPLYAIALRRAEASRTAHAEFDAACVWIYRRAERPGSVLSRHPGEVFLRSGRPGLSAPEGADTVAIEEWIARYGVAYLLVDDDRFAKAPTSPLGRYARSKGWEPAWESPKGTVRIFEVGQASRIP